MFSEFKAFAMRGNVIDMAVGIVIGSAFGKIVASFVGDVLMPPLGLLLGGVDFTQMFAALDGKSYETLELAQAAGAATLNYGMFIQTTVDFLIVAFAIFMVVRLMNKMKKQEPVAPAAPPAPTKEQILLTEIRDALRKA